MAVKEVAIKKRAQIDQATQYMLIAAAAAAVILGAAIVFVVYFSKYIVFNSKVIAEKGVVIKNLKTIQGNLEVLADNVDNLSRNEFLEVVGRGRENRCMDVEGNLIDTSGNIEMARLCSALRVIPDALPSVQNPEAVYASLNKLFLETQDENGQPVEPESIAPGDAIGMASPISGLGVIGVSLLIEESSSTARSVLDTIERSIRVLDVNTATIAWQGASEQSAVDTIELRGSAVAYYSDSIVAETKNKVVRASEDAKAPARRTAQ